MSTGVKQYHCPGCWAVVTPSIEHGLLCEKCRKKDQPLSALDQLEALLAAATKGRWVANSPDNASSRWAVWSTKGPHERDLPLLVATTVRIPEREHQANVHLVAEVKSALPALLACAKALEPFAKLVGALPQEHMASRLYVNLYAQKLGLTESDFHAAAEALKMLEAGG